MTVSNIIKSITSCLFITNRYVYSLMDTTPHNTTQCSCLLWPCVWFSLYQKPRSTGPNRLSIVYLFVSLSDTSKFNKHIAHQIKLRDNKVTVSQWKACQLYIDIWTHNDTLILLLSCTKQLQAHQTHWSTSFYEFCWLARGWPALMMVVVTGYWLLYEF